MSSRCHTQKFACRHPASSDINNSSNDQGYSGHLTIDKLSDDVLLRIFDSYRREYEDEIGHGGGMYMKATLDIWPALPISIQASFYKNRADEGDIIGALGNRDRIAGINFGGLTHSKFERCVALMQQSFPILSSLRLSTIDEETAYVSSDAFLGGSAPQLKRVFLSGIQFPALPKLLSSARGLVDLRLGDISIIGSGSISLEAMVTCLSVLTKLQALTISFAWVISFPFSDLTTQYPIPLTSTVLPALTDFSSEGPYDYLENFVARIDAPLLDYGELAFYDDETIIDTPRVPQFIHRTEMFKSLGGVDVFFSKESAPRKGRILLYLHSSIGPARFKLMFRCSGLSCQVALMVDTWIQCRALLSHVEWLQLGGDSLEELKLWPVPWLGFFEPFTAVQTLHLSGEVLIPHVAGTLGALTEEEAIKVLPTLHTLVLQRSEVVSEADDLLKPFIFARKHSEHPVVVQREDF